MKEKMKWIQDKVVKFLKEVKYQFDIPGRKREIAYYRRTVEMQGKAIKEAKLQLEEGLKEVEKCTDALLVEICRKYGSMKESRIEIPIPKAGEDMTISVQKVGEEYYIKPVMKDGEK